jgi:hypothetical protein
LLSICFIVTGFRGVAQTIDSNRVNLYGEGRIYDQKAVIRWIPGDMAAWQLGNLCGYRIVRISRDSIPLAHIPAASDEENQLLQDTLRSLQPDQWQILSDSLPLAKTAASLVLAMTKSTSQQPDTDPESAEDYFGMAMLLADIDPAIACALGVGFVDTNIVAGKIYTYKVAVNGHSHLTTSIKCHHTDLLNICPIGLPEAVWSDRLVTLSWKPVNNDSCYAFFNVERSADGGHTFERINALPIIPMYTEVTKETPVRYTDSLPSNGQVYHYRIRGVTPFGQQGPPSPTISGSGIDTRGPLLPYITLFQYNSFHNEYQISWRIDSSLNTEVSVYEIHEFTEKNTPGRNICSGGLSPDNLTFSSNQFKHGHYYAVIAVDQAGNSYSSTKKLFLSKDDHPPLPPTGLTAQIDTVGNALLSWSRNTEEDIQGYRVYVSNQQEGHYLEITPSPANDTFFLFQYPENTLQRRIYFRVSAIDLRGNYSQYANPHAIEIPDRIPPSAPVFSSALAEYHKITLCWIHSSSQDVVNHQLQRTIALQDRETQEWHAVANYNSSQGHRTSFEDTSAMSGITYKYRIVVSDASGNTNISDELYVEAVRKRPTPCLLGVRVQSEQNTGRILLEWNAPLHTEADRYIIYSSEGEKKLQSRAILDGNSGIDTLQGRHFRYIEVHTNRNQNYRYQIAAKDRTGQTIDLSPIISIIL